MKYTIREKLAALWGKLTANRLFSRVIALLLALALLQGDLMLPAYSAEEESGETSTETTVTDAATDTSAQEQAEQAELPVDEETLFVTLDGAETTALELLPYEKVEIHAEGLDSDADYQWQIRHPETGEWVSIYDATEQTLPVSAALVTNMLDGDGTAALRCRAYTGEYAYLSPIVRVTLLEETAAAQLFSLADEAVPMAEGDSTDTSTEFVTIEIHYIKYEYVEQTDDKGVKTYVEQETGEAYGAYVATIHSGDSFSVVVPTPVLVGYSAALELSDGQTGAVQETVDGVDSIKINLSSVTESIKFRVEYHPAKVNYRVHYYFQNIYDDQYVEDTTLAPTKTLQGFTGDMPDATVTHAAFEGFTSLFYEPDIIAADGSTVFNVYYERNYYLMEFDCNGGYGTDTIYVRYGTYVAVADPVRAGYVFAGWDLVKTEEDPQPTLSDNVADSLPGTMPPYNSGYQAIWTTTDTTYTEAYWILSSDGTSKSYIGARELDSESGISVTGSDYLLTGDDTKYVCGQDEHTHGTSCGECVLSEHTHTDSCVVDTTYLVFVSAETSLVEGDGSTVVNVYYKYKEYTLKFYYAMSSGTEDDDTTNDHYYVIGGSTYAFGTLAASSVDTSNEIELLDQFMNSNLQVSSDYKPYDHRGEVDELPTLKTDRYGTQEKLLTQYDPSTVNGTAYKYYYISFKASYGENISNLWPCDVFNSVTRSDKDSTNGWSGKEAFVSAWNGEHHVWYSQHNTNNQTIKGNYEVLDYKILWEDTYDGPDDMTVSYLCFWENGANIGWSVPELYRYNIYLECAAGVDYTGKTTVEKIVTYTNEKTDQIVTKTAKFYLADSYDTCDNSSVSEQTQVSLTGYTNVGYDSSSITDFDTSLYSEAYNINFYYIGTEYSLSYFNHNGFMEGKSQIATSYATNLSESIEETTALFYETDDGGNITGYNADFYPDTLEPGAYYFAGWYTSPDCLADTEFGNFLYDASNTYIIGSTGCTMPASDLTLYAKWEPVKHNVYFHLTYAEMEQGINWIPVDSNGNEVSITYPIVVEHNQILGTTYNYTPVRSEDYDGDGVNDYVFVGWFYMDEDNKKRFAPDTMEIKKDLHLFAEWQSKIDTKYEVTYVLQEDATINGQPYYANTVLAVATEGHSTAGRTKTFIAKAGEQLLDAFKDAPVFPVTNTHSILMDSDPTNNTYTFEYVVDDDVYYTVRHVDKTTGAVLGIQENIVSHNAIVTEKFQYFAGYVPEQFYIRKVLAADGSATSAIADNVITFYYLPNTESEALYNVEYYKKNPATGKYEQTQTEPGRAVIGASISVTAPADKFSGYAYTKGEILVYASDGSNTTTEYTTTTLTAALSQYGLVFKLYYDPIQYPYLIRFMEYGTTNILGYGKIGDSAVYTSDDVKNVTADFETELTYIAPDSITITNTGKKYTLIQDSAQTQTLTIRIEADTTDASNCQFNILTFYYEAEVIPIEYHAVCTVPGITGGTVSQNSDPTPQTPKGCNAMKLTGFTFEGWYDDEACTLPVPEAWLSEDKTYITPKEVIKDEDGKKHFYALFQPIITSLTIKKVVNDDTDCDDTFLFRVQGAAGTVTDGVDVIVSITGNGSAILENLYCGSYTVTELTAWSYRYSTEKSTIQTIVTTGGTEVTFTNTYIDSDWLGGECYKDNNFTNSN